MENFLIKKPSSNKRSSAEAISDSEELPDSETPPTQKVSTIRSYKSNLNYEDAWRKKYP